MCVVVDGDVFDISEVFQVECEVLLSEGRHLCAEILVGEVAEGLWIRREGHCWSFRW